uniref:Uncharacterized protein n=1 Tax=Panagrolaimus sp. PS1159 TaxID=55785 RepID=A0AC35GPN8_9BILA
MDQVSSDYFTSTIFVIFILAHIVTVVIFSCTRKKEIKKLLPSEINTGSISCRAPKNDNEPIMTPPKENDKITSTEKEKEKATTPISSAKPGGGGSELPTENTQNTKESKLPSEKVEKKMPSKKENETPAKLKESPRPRPTSISSNLKADQERSNVRPSSNSKISGLTAETKAIRSGGGGRKTESTQSELSKTQSLSEKSRKSSKSKRSKREKK